jgi:hypothetical protein
MAGLVDLNSPAYTDVVKRESTNPNPLLHFGSSALVHFASKQLL